MTNLAYSVRQDARSVFAYRGKYRQRNQREELRRPWVAVRRSGVQSYRIDRTHPMVVALRSNMADGLQSDLEGLLTILEHTVPVEQIWLDAAEMGDRIAAPLHGMTSRQVRQLIEIAYDAIRRNQELTHDDAVQLLLTCEEFADEEARAAIASLPHPPRR